MISLLFGVFISIVTCFFWGSTSLVMRGIKTIKPLDMTFMRSVGGLICSSILFFTLSDTQFTATGTQMFLFYIMVSVNNLIGDVFLFFALHKIGVARGASISSSYPILVAIFSHFLFGSPYTWTTAAGTVATAVGLAILCRKDTARNVGAPSLTGLVCAILAMLFWCAGLLLHKLLLNQGFTPLGVAFGRGISFFSLTLAILIFDIIFIRRRKLTFAQIAQTYKNYPKRELLFAAIAGAMSLALGAWLYGTAMLYIPQAAATTIGSANPILAALVAVPLFKEYLSSRQWFGIFLAVVGTILVVL